MIKFNKEQVYIVTGASSGIGEGVALMLNELGASVVAIARRSKELEEMKAKCKYPENMFLEIKDLVEDIDKLPDYVKDLKNKYGKFSGMACCAGVSVVAPLSLVDYQLSVNSFNINYFVPIMLTKGIVDRRNNIGKGCSLVYLSSIDANLRSKGQPIYSGTKSALCASIKAISHEVAPYGVRANCLLPSMIETPMTLSAQLVNLGVTEDSQKELYPFGWGEVSDVANMAIYLLSDKAKFISGQNYVIDSGGVM